MLQERAATPGLAAAVSHGAGVGLYAVLVLLGLGSLFAAAPALALVITWAGALFLLWLGAKALFAAQGPGAEAGLAPGRRIPLAGAIREGFLVAFLNPKLAVFFMALFAQFVEPGQSLASQALMAATAWVVDTLWYLLVAALLLHPRWLPWLRRNGPGSTGLPVRR